jgi:uncharacterized protein involved in exopolysaccharide biosynthesis
VRRQIEDVKKEIAAADAPAAAVPGAPVRAGVPIQIDSVPIQQLRAQLRASDIGIQEKKREQAAIQTRLSMYEERVQSTPEVEAEYKELTRDYNSANGFYQDLLGKMNRSKMATDLEKRQEGEQFRVMDEPNLPDSPSYPKLSVFAGGGLFFGLALGLAITAFQEYKDTALRSEKDVWAFTQLPTLGIISVAGHMPDVETPTPGRLRRFFGWFFGLFGRLFRKLRRKPKSEKPKAGKSKMPKDTLVDSHV